MLFIYSPLGPLLVPHRESVKGNRSLDRVLELACSLRQAEAVSGTRFSPHNLRSVAKRHFRARFLTDPALQ